MSAPSERPRSERERYRDLIVDGAVRLMQADWEARSVADTVLAVHRAAKQADEYAALRFPEDAEALKRITSAMVEDAKADTEAGRGGGFRIPDSMLDEPEPAPVEGAVERLRQDLEWNEECNGPDAKFIDRLLCVEDLRAVLDELERLRSPKGGEPATGGES